VSSSTAVVTACISSGSCGADQADLRRARLRARRRALGSCRPARLKPARLPRGTRSARSSDSRGRIDEPTHVNAVATLEELYAQLRIVAIDEPLAREAGELAAQHALRGYVAFQLACALHLEGDAMLLATWDDILNSAARATGQLIANDTG
jgi:hypothetical protein